MTLLTEPTRIVLRKTWQPMDTDAAAYITAVETADGQALEEKTKIAIDNFVLGCKADGIWTAIKASCILAGARTLAGALVPLAGTAPTNVGPFASGDYNRNTGLVGNGSTKHLNSNRNNNADPTNNFHYSCFISTANSKATGVPAYIGSSDVSSFIYAGRLNATVSFFYNKSAVYATLGSASPVGFIGSSRNTSTNFTARIERTSQFFNINSIAGSPVPINIYARATNTDNSNARLAFYSIGESLDLARLDARVTDLINAFAVTIP